MSPSHYRQHFIMSEGYGCFSELPPSCADIGFLIIYRTLASAVAIPEQDTLRQSPELPAKRRKSSVTEHDPKRRRLSAQDEGSLQSQPRRPSSPAQDSEQPTEKATCPGGDERTSAGVDSDCSADCWVPSRRAQIRRRRSGAWTLKRDSRTN